MKQLEIKKYPINKDSISFINNFQKKIIELQKSLQIKNKGPYDKDLLFELATYFNSQIHLIKCLDDINCNIESFPTEFDDSKRQIFYILRLTTMLF